MDQSIFGIGCDRLRRISLHRWVFACRATCSGGLSHLIQHACKSKCTCIGTWLVWQHDDHDPNASGAMRAVAFTFLSYFGWSIPTVPCDQHVERRQPIVVKGPNTWSVLSDWLHILYSYLSFHIDTLQQGLQWCVTRWTCEHGHCSCSCSCLQLQSKYECMLLCTDTGTRKE